MSQPIFRSIQVGTDQQLTLDAPIPDDVMRLMHRTTVPDQYKMNPGTFHRAQSIAVTVAAADQNVQRMDFTYDPGTSYETLLQEYTMELGTPAQDNPEAPPAERRSLWEDARTSFELFAQGDGSSSRVGSSLQNRAPAAS